MVEQTANQLVAMLVIELVLSMAVMMVVKKD